MAKKHLPIQFFEKRKDFDDRSTEGGGGSTHWLQSLLRCLSV